MDKVQLSFPTAANIKVVGDTTESTDSVNLSLATVNNTKANGLTTNAMEQGSFNGVMVFS